MRATYSRIDCRRLCWAAVLVLMGTQAGLALTENLILNGEFRPGVDESPARWFSYAVMGAFRQGGNMDIVDFESIPQGVTVTPRIVVTDTNQWYGTNRWFDMGQRLYLTAASIDKLRFRGRVGVEGGGDVKVYVSFQPHGESGVRSSLRGFSLSVTNTAGALKAVDGEMAVPSGAYNIEVAIGSRNVRRFSLASFSLEPVYELKPDAKPVLLGSKKDGQKLSRIWISRAALENERLAAMLLRQNLHILTGSAPDLGEWQDGADARGGFFIGRAAREARLCRDEDIKAVPPGGCRILTAADRGAIYGGKDNLGNVEGVMGLLRDLGVRHVTREIQRRPEVKEALVLPAQDRIVRPAFQYSFCDESGYSNISEYEFGYHHMNDCWANPAKVSMFAVEGHWVHNSSFLVPYRKYHAEHPEYYAMAGGKRLELKPGGSYNVHICMSNPEVQRIAAETVMRWMECQPECTYFTVNPGDGLSYCECPACLALDPDPKASRTDSWLTFVNGVAERVAKRLPDKRIVTLAYVAPATEAPPQRVKPAANVDIMYCLWWSDWPCGEHDFCALNEKGRRHLEQWTQLCPGRVHIFDYGAAEVERMRWFKELGIVGVYHCWGDGELLQRYLAGLWMWDQTPGAADAARDEYFRAYVGPAARPLRKYYDLFEREVAANRDHKQPGRLFHWQAAPPSRMTREFAEKACRLLDDAIARAGTNRVFLARVRGEKAGLLRNDLNRHNKGAGLEGRELEDYARQLSDYIRIMTNAAPGRSLNVFSDMPIRVWLAKTARVRMGTNTLWHLDPVILALATNPVSVICAESVDQEAAPGGWKIPAERLYGGEGPKPYAGKTCVILRRASSPTPWTEARFKLDAAPASDARLIVSGMDDEKPGKAVIRITVNGSEVYTGTNALAEANNWSEMRVPLPANLLRKGRNTVKVINTTPDRPADVARPTDMRYEAQQAQQQDYNWGWLAISEMRLQLGLNP